MKEKQYSPYATNKGGKIEAPRKSESEPKASVIRGEDLRVGKASTEGSK